MIETENPEVSNQDQAARKEVEMKQQLLEQYWMMRSIMCREAAFRTLEIDLSPDDEETDPNADSEGGCSNTDSK